MGPSALRIAGLQSALEALGHTVNDTGNLTPRAFRNVVHPNATAYHLGEMIEWIEELFVAGYEYSRSTLPIFLGGDHALSAGTLETTVSVSPSNLGKLDRS